MKKKPVPKLRKVKAYKKKSTKTRQLMLDAYLNRQTINYVAHTCHVSRETANHYKIADEWDAAVDKMQKRITRAAVTKGVNRTSRNIKALDKLIKNGLKQLKKESKGKVPLAMMHQIIKTQDELIRRNPEHQDAEEMSPEVTEAVKVLAGLSKKEMNALGNMMVEEMKSQTEGGV